MIHVPSLRTFTAHLLRDLGTVCLFLAGLAESRHETTARVLAEREEP